MKKIQKVTNGSFGDKRILFNIYSTKDLTNSENEIIIEFRWINKHSNLLNNLKSFRANKFESNIINSVSYFNQIKCFIGESIYYLNLSNCGLDKSNIENFIEMIKNLQNLNRLNISDNNINIKMFANILNELKNNPKVSEIFLNIDKDFFSCYLSEPISNFHCLPTDHFKNITHTKKISYFFNEKEEGTKQDKLRKCYETGNFYNHRWDDSYINIDIEIKKGENIFYTNFGLMIILKNKLEKDLVMSIQIYSNTLSINSNIKNEKNIGFLILPYSILDEQTIFSGENYLIENQRATIDLNSKNDYYFLNIYNNLNNEYNLFLCFQVFEIDSEKFLCSFSIRSNWKRINSLKNLIFLKRICMNRYSDTNLELSLIIGKNYVLQNKRINCIFLHKGIDFQKSFQISSFNNDVVIDFRKLEQVFDKHSDSFRSKFSINERFISSIRSIFSTKIYNGEEIELDVENAKLFVPKDAVKDAVEILSIKSKMNFRVSKEAVGCTIENLIVCEPSGVEFSSDVILSMKPSIDLKDSSKINLRPYDSENKLEINKKTKEVTQKIKHFSDNGIAFEWNEKTPLLIQYNIEYEKNERQMLNLHLTFSGKRNIRKYVSNIF